MKLAVVEVKLLTREPGAIFTLLIPLFILVVFGSSIEPGDTVLLPMALAIAVGLVGLYLLPTTLATYRERGILRRMSTTPVRPANLLAVQVLLQLVLALTTCALLITVAGTVLDARLPTAVGRVAVTFLLGTGAMFAVGLLIAALARNGRTANGVGVLLYFPMAYLAGLMQPTDQMPQLLARIGEYTPLGAFRQGMHQVWADTTPSPVLLGVLAAYAVTISAVAARYFRWE
ncbi:ABC transporter permease [Dactylosporangium siamense]|uniref:Transport permease protein n=2 Tax=Dactylosporangium siamense TaxID=685454 RepID=A0A919Q1E6_9ACTN|nr:transport permease protein [Dactylosporangium siamense]